MLFRVIPVQRGNLLKILLKNQGIIMDNSARRNEEIERKAIRRLVDKSTKLTNEAKRRLEKINGEAIETKPLALTHGEILRLKVLLNVLTPELTQKIANALAHDDY